jgi:hypothetical protein
MQKNYGGIGRGGRKRHARRARRPQLGGGLAAHDCARKLAQRYLSAGCRLFLRASAGIISSRSQRRAAAKAT